MNADDSLISREWNGLGYLYIRSSLTVLSCMAAGHDVCVGWRGRVADGAVLAEARVC